MQSPISRSANAPNNLGPTLLIVLGFLTLPVLIGLPLLLHGLTQLRNRDGHQTFAHLLPWRIQPRV